MCGTPGGAAGPPTTTPAIAVGKEGTCCAATTAPRPSTSSAGKALHATPPPAGSRTHLAGPPLDPAASCRVTGHRVTALVLLLLLLLVPCCVQAVAVALHCVSYRSPGGRHGKEGTRFGVSGSGERRWD